MSERLPHHPYRAAGAALAARVATLEREVVRLGARIRPPYWARLGSALSTRLARLGSGQHAPTAERERALQQLRDELAGAVAEASRLEPELDALPNSIDETALGTPWPPALGEVLLAGEWRDRPLNRIGTLAERLARFVGRHDTGAEVITAGDSVRAPRFQAHSSPFGLQATVELGELAAFALVTPVARGVGALTLGPMGWLQELATQVGLRRDTLTGKAEFDKRFLVQSDPETAGLLLCPPVRQRLTELSYHAPPQLEVGDGLARLQWTGYCDEAQLGRGIEILTTIRHTKVPALITPG